MFSFQIDQTLKSRKMSGRGRNMLILRLCNCKIATETATCITERNYHLHNCNTNSYMYNYYRKSHMQDFSRNCHMLIQICSLSDMCSHQDKKIMMSKRKSLEKKEI